MSATSGDGDDSEVNEHEERGENQERAEHGAGETEFVGETARVRLHGDGI